MKPLIKLYFRKFRKPATFAKLFQRIFMEVLKKVFFAKFGNF